MADHDPTLETEELVGSARLSPRGPRPHPTDVLGEPPVGPPDAQDAPAPPQDAGAADAERERAARAPGQDLAVGEG